MMATGEKQGTTILRVKRERETPALDVVAIELRTKRPRLDVEKLGNLSLADDSKLDHNEDAAERGRRRVKFRRIDADVASFHDLDGRSRFIDVAREHLRRFRGGKDASETTAENLGRGSSGQDVAGSFLDQNCESKADSHSESPFSDSVSLDSQSVCNLTCNGQEMLRETRINAMPAIDFKSDDSTVFDLYAQDGSLETVLDGEEDGSRAEESMAVVLAEDLPDIDFLDGYSSDSLLEDKAPYDDEDPSEGSIDYPSTPNDDIYVREVVEYSGESSDDSNRQCFSEDHRCHGAALFGFVRSQKLSGDHLYGHDIDSPDDNDENDEL